MTSDQQQAVNNMVNTQRTVQQDWMNYWQHYSNATTWQFWACLISFIVPLVVLYFVLDRKRAFRIGFYGFNVHVWFGYIDAFGLTHGLWAYPFKVLPIRFPNVTLEASLVPVAYMLIYQWTLTRNRSYYLYATILSAVLAFIVKPPMSWLGLFRMYQWMNYVYLFCGYLVIMLLSKWITDFFAYLQAQHGKDDTRTPMEGIRVRSRRWRPKERSPF